MSIGQNQSSTGGAKRNQRAGINLQHVLQVLKLRKKIVIFFTIFMVIGSLLKLFLYVPSFTAQSEIGVRKPKRNPITDISNVLDEEQDEIALIKRYMRYLKSNTFFLSVAQTLKFTENYDQLNFVSPREMSYTKAKFWEFFFAYRSGDKVARNDALDAPEPVLIPVENLAAIVQDLVSVETDGSSSITISATTMDPYTSMAIANAAAQVFERITNERDQGEVSQVRSLLDKQLKDTTEELKKSELELVNFKKKNNIMALDKEHRLHTDKLSRLDVDMETAKLQLQQNQKLISYYESRLTRQETGIIKGKSGNDPNAAASEILLLRKKLNTLGQQRAALIAQNLTEQDWQIKEIDASINQTAKLLKDKLSGLNKEQENEIPIDPEQAREKMEELKRTNKGLESQIAAVALAREKLLASLEDLPSDEQRLLELQRRMELQFDLYSSLNRKLQEVEIQRASQNAKVSIEELSGVPGPAPRPGFMLSLVFSALAGFFFGTVVALALELMDGTVKLASDLEALDMLVLGEIPQLGKHSVLNWKLLKPAHRQSLLVAKLRPDSRESMTFKYIRTQLKQLRRQDGAAVKTIAIMSAGDSEGKTLVASNLGVCGALINSSQRVAIVDCDFRNSGLPWYFGFQNEHGLSSVLTMRALLEDVLIRDKVQNLDIIPAGWAYDNPTSLIEDEKFRLLLEFLKMEYDYIVIDCPSILSYVDAAILASMSDIAVLVAAHRKTKKEELELAHQRIQQISHKQVYAILNGVEPEKQDQRVSLTERMRQLGKKLLAPFGRSKARLPAQASYEPRRTQRKAG